MPFVNDIKDCSHLGVLENFCLLVVDDSIMNLDICGHILTEAGANVVLCTSGTDAIEVMRIRKGIDLVFMDIQMPELDGIETTRQIKALSGCGQVPVVALSASLSGDEREQAIQAGINRFLVKPVDPDVLINVVMEQMHNHGTVVDPTASVCSRSGYVPVADLARTPQDVWPDIPGLDVSHARFILAGRLHLFTQLLELLVQEQHDWALRMGEMIAQGNRFAAAREAHKLKGQLGNVGATRLRAAVAELEDMLQLSEPPVEASLRSCQEMLDAVLTSSRVWLQSRPVGL